MSPSAGDTLLLVAAGLGAGTVNGAAGGGTLVSFPALLAVGLPALRANVTSTVGICPGYLGGVAGFRAEVRSQPRRCAVLSVPAVAGAAAGSILLLVTPERAFRSLAPYLVLVACALFAVQPLVSKQMGRHAVPAPRSAAEAAADSSSAEKQAAEKQAVERQAVEKAVAEQAVEKQAAEKQAAEKQAAERQAVERQAVEKAVAEQAAAPERHETAGKSKAPPGPAEQSGGGRPRLDVAGAGTFLGSVYGGYFGAGLGVVFLALLGLALPDDLVRTNGLRSVLSLVVNLVAAVVFIIHAHVAWGDAGLLAGSSLVGGYAGARIARRLPPTVFRVLVIGLGAATAASLLAG